MQFVRALTFLVMLSTAALVWGQSAPTVPAAPATPAAPALRPTTTAVDVPPPENAPSDPPAAADPDTHGSVTVDTPKTASHGPVPDSLRPAPATSFDQVVDRIIARENEFRKNIRQYQPLVETYIQNMKSDPTLGAVPDNDRYFLGKLELTAAGSTDTSFLPKRGLFQSMLAKMTSLFNLEYMPLGFATMIMPDNGGFTRQNYEFKFVRREFVGEVRTIVVDVTPKPHTGNGRFIGRMWVEDQDYNIVRFNGTYGPAPRMHSFLHFDSWRLNMKPGLWLPAYIYSEESDLKAGLHSVHFKAQTRLWGYEKHVANANSEFSEMVVDDQQIKDQSEAGHDLSPVESQRAWQRQAEDNVLDRLTRAGLLAPAGDVDKVLETVVNNLLVTNNLDVEPAIRCRVLLTAPMESFSVGHTIVISRGLIDVLPDEATLASVLSHEVAHIALGHKFDTKYAFVDRMLFRDEETFRKLHFHQNAADEAAADTKAIALMRNSPYKDKLDSVGLFLKALQARQKDLPNLIVAHLGNGVAHDNHVRMSELSSVGPSLDLKKVDQVAALPLGARLRVDPFTDRVDLVKAKPVALLSAREKMSFEVTPMYPFITRFGDTASSGVSTATAKPPSDK